MSELDEVKAQLVALREQMDRLEQLVRAGFPSPQTNGGTQWPYTIPQYLWGDKETRAAAHEQQMEEQRRSMRY